MTRNKILLLILVLLLIVLYIKNNKNIKDNFTSKENLEKSEIKQNEVLFREMSRGGITDVYNDVLIDQYKTIIFDTHYKIKVDNNDTIKKLITELETINPYDLLILGKDYDYISEYDTLYHYIIVKGVDIDYKKLELMAQKNTKYEKAKNIIDNIRKYVELVKHKDHRSW
jgi:hypothetical protein